MGYFFIIFLFGILPTVIFLYFGRHLINWKALLISEVFIFIIAAVSDYVGIHTAVWAYGTAKVIGINILSIPLEDYIFFLLIPPWIIGCYEILKSKIK